MSKRQPKERGLTLIELLVTLSIAVILLTIAVPSFQDFFRRNRVDSAASDLIAALNYARSEAIRRGINTTVCKSKDGSSCNTESCPAQQSPTPHEDCWERGWIVMAGTEVLRVQQALPPSVTLRANAPFADQIVYRPNGSLTQTAGGSYFICHRDDANNRRAVVVNGAGRVRVENTNSCS